MKLVEIMIEKLVQKTITDIENLIEKLDLEADENPIETARKTANNKPIMNKIMKKQLFLTILKGI